MRNKRWEPIEDMILKVWCDQESHEQLAVRLGRTKRSVQSRFVTLGLKKKKVYANRVWTKEMETFLKTRAGNQSTKSIAKALGMSVYSVKCKAVRMGLCLRTRKNRLWSDSEVECLVNALAVSTCWADIAEVVGRSEFSCRKKAGELDLNLNLRRPWTTKELKIIHQYRLNDISYKEVAKMLSRTEHSVRKRYARYKKEAGIS